jgi:pimeloyl-ACP methyl ester carboxylesterase
MSTITNLFQQALLAEAAYANFVNGSGVLLTNPDDIITALTTGDGKFSPTQATEFVTHWRVVDHIPDTLTGFSATIFESLDNPGHYSLAIRGSTPSQLMTDFIADAQLIFNDGVAAGQLVDLYNFWQRSNAPAGTTYTAARLALSLDPQSPINIGGYYYNVEFVDSSQLSNPDLQLGTGKLNSSITSIDVSGHSLGGHLAMAFTALFPGLNANAIAVNGLGFKLDNPNVNNLFSALGGSASFNAADIQNVYGIDGPEFAAMNNFMLQQPGGWDGIYIEDSGLATWGGHSIGQMTDSLATYSILSQLNPTLTLDQITSLLNASSSKAENTLESALADLGQVFGKTYPSTEAADPAANRDTFYTNLYDLQSVLPSPSAGLTVVSLVGMTRDAILAKAKQTDAEGQAYRYALQALNPFVVLGIDYQTYNTNGELNLYDSTTDTGLSDRHLADCASLLINKIWSGINDQTNALTGDDLALYGGVPQVFDDRNGTDQYRLYLVNDMIADSEAPLNTMTRIIFDQSTGVGSGFTIGRYGNDIFLRRPVNNKWNNGIERSAA